MITWLKKLFTKPSKNRASSPFRTATQMYSMPESTAHNVVPDAATLLLAQAVWENHAPEGVIIAEPKHTISTPNEVAAKTLWQQSGPEGVIPTPYDHPIPSIGAEATSSNDTAASPDITSPVESFSPSYDASSYDSGSSSSYDSGSSSSYDSGSSSFDSGGSSW